MMHTPGPWKTDPDIGHQQVLGPDGIAVADCSITLLHKDGPTPERNRANAHLIAAAPEMLEAIKSVVKWLGHDELENSKNANKQISRALKACRAAIAKANLKAKGDA